MEPQSNQPPLVVILGETASGKSALALELAQAFDGEIIAADSRTVYKGLDIGTAKPTPVEQKLVPHHLLDVVEPDESFTVSDFKRLANQTIQEISARGHVPFLVGGSGLYIDAVLYDFSFRSTPDPALRPFLEKLSVDELQTLILDKKLPLPANERNPRHLLRILETEGITPDKKPLRQNTLILGMQTERETLQTNISKRADEMLKQGAIEEAKAVADRSGWDAPALQDAGYRAIHCYLKGEINFEETRRRFVQSHLQLAKRQRTWFKRNKSIHWVTSKEEVVDVLTTFLNK